MIFNSSPPNSEGANPVRLLAFGSTGLQFAQALYEGAAAPLADMLAEHPTWFEPEDLAQTVRNYDFEGMAFLFIVVGVDATDYEVAHAAMLAWAASESGVNSIGIVVTPSTPAHGQLRYEGSRWPWQPAILLSFLRGMVDGLIEVYPERQDHDLQALRWLYGTLRSLAREGFLILEPAWDLHDITEVLDLPKSRLTLMSRTVAPGETAVTALSDALADLHAQGVELELAGGVLLIVWQAPPHRLTMRQVGEMSRMVRRDLGTGGQHLVLTARTAALTDGSTDIGACATLVVSRGTQHLLSGDLP